jgi:hypothetical protein
MLKQKHTGKLPTTERSADDTVIVINRKNIDGSLERLTDVAGTPSVGRKALSYGRRSASKHTVTNRFETFRCQACGRGVKRKSRQQRFCSDRCRNYAHRNAPSQINGRTAIKNASGYLDSGAVTNPHFLSSKNNELRGP